MSLFEPKTMSAIIENHQWIYAKRPEKEVSSQHYVLNKQNLSTELARNEVLLAHYWLR